MGIAVVRIAFENILENGVTTFKIRFERAQTAKIAIHMIKNKNGDILRKKGDTYFINCSVTGSNYRTADDPKFPLLQFFQKSVFSAIKELVKVTGEYEGFTLVI